METGKIWILIFFFGIAAVRGQGEILAPAVTFARLGFGFNISSGQIGAMMMNPDFTAVKRNVDFISTDYKLVTSSKDAKRVLNIGGSLSLDMAFGSAAGFSLSAAGSYLNDEGDRRDYAELLFSSRVRNVEHHIVEPANQVVANCRQLSEAQKGSHVITGITTGGHCIVSVKFWVSSSKKKEEIEAEARAGLDASVASGGISGKLRRLTSVFGKKANVTVSTFCSTVMGLLPTNAEEAIKTAENFLQQHLEQNPGGVPMVMRLTPLSSFARCSPNVEPPPRNFKLEQLKESIAKKLYDVKFAYQEFVRCTSKFPLQEKKHLKYLKDLSEIKSSLRTLMIKLNDMEKRADTLPGNQSNFAELKRLYYQDMDRNTLTYDDTLWRDRIGSFCKNLAATWLRDQPGNKTSNEPDDTDHRTEKFKCRQRNLMLGAEMYYRYGSLQRGSSKLIHQEDKQNWDPPNIQLQDDTDILIHLKRPAAAVSYINIESSIPYRASLPKTQNPNFAFNLFGLQIFIGKWVKESELRNYRFNFENYAMILEYPSSDEKKIYSKVYKHYQTNGNLATSAERKFFAGVAIRKELDIKEPFGVLIVRNAGTPKRFNKHWITGLELFGTECILRNESFG